MYRLAARAALAAPSVGDLSEHQLRQRAEDLRARLRTDGFRGDLVAGAFAVVREVAGRTVGQRHRLVQLVGGGALLGGLVAEMETGEGKTLTATLAASTAALAGIPVHIVTVNDYLATRDAEWMAPIYRGLGLSAAAVVHGMDALARRAAYACDVTYCTNKELAFDYLRDRLVLGQRADRLRLTLEELSAGGSRARRLVLRGLHYAIVDEADSVLVDEARTPLVISGGAGIRTERRLFEQALDLGDRLTAEHDFVVDARDRDVRLTALGCARLAELAAPLGAFWAARLRREHLVRQALAARHLFQRDTHYLVTATGKVAIVDEFTGRLMADRAWELDLHQLIEVKEGCAPTASRETLARISYQRFFRRYLRLAGMTATAREIASELWAVYRLAVLRVPTDRPVRRRALPDRIYARAAERWAAVARRTHDIHATGRPVLIGTRSVGASEMLGTLLTEAGVPHRVLNARQDRDEADIVARAGQPSQVTVATNMAGRGTDIRLGPGVAEAGGLHVIATERHDARRIDRQLFGRGGRHGDPGTFEAIVSLEDEVVVRYGGRWRRLAAAPVRRDGTVASTLARLVVRHAQRVAERRHARARQDVMRIDEELDAALGFAGPPE